MKRTLEVIDRMHAAGVIRKYAIGGAVGATFYLEPVSTFDIDIFISFRGHPPSSLITLDKVYDYLRPMGYATQGEHILIEDWNVQFLAAPDPLCEEAVEEANETEVAGVRTFVMRPEYLMAIALQTARGKDFLRLQQFIAEDTYDPDALNTVLMKHGLSEKWKAFNLKYTQSGEL